MAGGGVLIFLTILEVPSKTWQTYHSASVMGVLDANERGLC